MSANEAAMHAGVDVRLDRVTKLFGSVKAVDNVSLDIAPGSFVTLLGPSGSGKTTTLNLIAGFISPDAGDVLFSGKPVSHTPPNLRDIGMVFQSYALFPHMTVFDNVAFPLRMRTRLDAGLVAKRVKETLELVQLSGFENRYPRQLSGGQQQRVAMARALVSQPKLLLMDEPLGALDKKLREQMQAEVKRIHRLVGSTFIYVTHDQSEALTMSDVVVVMANSRISQSGRPEELYDNPANAFVADFLGGANLLPARIAERKGLTFAVDLPQVALLHVPVGTSTLKAGDAATVFVRPERISLAGPGQLAADMDSLSGRLVESVYLGDSIRLTVMVGEATVFARVARFDSVAPALGAEVRLQWPRAASRVLPVEAA